MSPDVIGMIIALFAFTVTVLGGVAGMLARLTKSLEGRFDRLDGRMDRLDVRMDRLEGRMDRLEGRMDQLQGELIEVKVSVARWEGPPRRLQQL